MRSTYLGGCHCRRVRFAVSTDLAGVTECNCSICRCKGYLHLIVSTEQFELLSGAEDLVTYSFNTGVAQHRFCRHCGIHSFYVPRSDPDKIDVNVRCLDEVDPARLEIHRFDGQNWEESMQGKVPWREEPPLASRCWTLTVKPESVEEFSRRRRPARFATASPWRASAQGAEVAPIEGEEDAFSSPSGAAGPSQKGF